jgi:surfeit locus 1 family protein
MTAAAQRGVRSVILASIVSAIGVAILISLGVWQLDRLAWKETLIATLQDRLSASPIDLPPRADWTKLTPENSEFRRVRLHGTLSAPPAAYVYAGAPALRSDIKSPGYFVFAPVRLPGGETVVVNAGWVPTDRQHAPLAGVKDIVGYLRWPEQPGLFVSDHDAAGDVWFVRDPRAMAKVRGWGEVAPFYIDMETPVPTGGLPRPAPLTVNLRNNHLGYAWTWFGLAATLAGVFSFWLYYGRTKP